MDFFRELGLTLYEKWKACDWDDAAFSAIATETLVARPPSNHVSLLDLVNWVHSAAELGPQGDPQYRFGEPNIRVFESERFYIEALCWVSGTTAIHQHAFSGAFHVLDGSSIQSEYEFREERRFNDHLMGGSLHLKGVELLKKGETRPIRSGDRLIHALFHLDRPSVSIVARTRADAVGGPQFAYLRPAIAHDPFYVTASMRKMGETLRLLSTIEHSAFEDVARDSIRKADSHTAFHLMYTLMSAVDSFERYRALLESVLPAHPELIRRMLLVEEEERREANIILRRRQIRHPEHRFLLALLLNVPERSRILNLVHSAFPTRDPIAAVVGWTGELGSTRLAGSDESLIGIDLDESALDVLRHMLTGAKDSQVLAALEKDYSVEEVETNRQDVLALCDAFRQSLLFRPLFVE